MKISSYIAAYGNSVLTGLPPAILQGDGYIFFVNNGSAAAADTVATNNGHTWALPFSSIDYAIGQCSGSTPDIILVAPGHTEALVAAKGIVCDVAGVYILGVGYGTLRPLITFGTATTVDMDIDAANVTFDNVRFDFTTVDAVAAPIDVNASDFTMKRCDLLLADAGGQATLAITADANAHNMTIQDCYFHGSADAGTVEAILLAGASDNTVIRNNKFVGAYTAGTGAISITGAATNIDIDGNFMSNLTANSTVCILCAATVVITGLIRNNMYRVTTDHAILAVTFTATTGTTVGMYNNYQVNAPTLSGLISGTPSAAS
jgi:hypothetical protein